MASYPVRLEYSCSWADNVCSTIFVVCYLKCVLELIPASHVGLDEDAAGRICIFGKIVLHELFCFGAEAEVCDDYVTASLEEELREGEVDSCRQKSTVMLVQVRLMSPRDAPLPAPVIKAVLPWTVNGTLADLAAMV